MGGGGVPGEVRGGRGPMVTSGRPHAALVVAEHGGQQAGQGQGCASKGRVATSHATFRGGSVNLAERATRGYLRHGRKPAWWASLGRWRTAAGEREHRMSTAVRGMALAATAVLLAACSSVFGSDETEVLEVAEGTVPCIGVVAGECLLVRFPGEAEFQLLHGGITGFVPDFGYRYRLRVSRHAVRAAPADGASVEYRLVRVEGRQQSPRGAELAEMQQQLALWRERRPAGGYTLTLERLCFCATEGRGPVLVEVVVPPAPGFELVVAQRYLAGQAPVTAAMSHLFPGVEGLFGIIVRAAAEDVHRLEVHYHPSLGYPRRVFIDGSPAVADDEVEYRVLAMDAR
jgi:hypothetical protein